MSMFGNDGGMKRGRGRPKKDPFEKVSEGFKAKVRGAQTTEEINAIIAEVSKLRESTVAVIAAVPEVIQLREALKNETAYYRETITTCKQELAFVLDHLKSGGKL